MTDAAKKIAERVPLPEPVVLAEHRFNWPEVCKIEGYTAAQMEALRLAVAEEALRGEEAVVWRCFHCGEEFTDRDAAALHFGKHETQEPACVIDIAKFREMEALQLRYLDEDADVHRAMRRMQTEHQFALRRAEENGYAKGLADAAKYSADSTTFTTPPAGSVEVTDAMVERLRKIIRERWSLYLGPECARAALTAALQEPEA